MMKVEIINKEESLELFKYWGLAAAKCYATPKKFAERIGKSCLQTGHFSGSRGRYIMFDISGVPRALVDQLVRHEQGVFKNVESGRYVNFEDFTYYIPPILEKEQNALAHKLYTEHMIKTKIVYKEIISILNKNGTHGEKAYEAARGIMPMNYDTGLVIGFTVEALINLMNKRLCVCSQDHIRKLAVEMRKQVIELIPELEPHLVAACEANGWCPESKKRTCGKYPQKEVAIALIEEYRKNLHFQNMINKKIEKEENK